MTKPTDTPPILCNMTGAPDTPAERLATYAALFDDALVGRERTPHGIRLRFRADPGIEDRVRELARREQACCSFFSFAIEVRDGEVRWDASVPDDELARQALDELLALPDVVGEDLDAVFERYDAQGFRIMVEDGAELRPATAAELGLDT
jgi:hypothetical protein